MKCNVVCVIFTSGEPQECDSQNIDLAQLYQTPPAHPLFNIPFLIFNQFPSAWTLQVPFFLFSVAPLLFF